MSIKISEMRNMYIPTFETEEERLAWEAEQQAKFDAAVADKVTALKALYAANPTLYSKFSDFDESDWTVYASNELRYYSAYVNSNFMGDLVSSLGMKPEDGEWAKFTYEEILQMEADGVLIPDDVLAWAHSMEESDVNNFDVEDDGSEDIDDSPASELDEMKKNTEKLGRKSKKAQEDSKQKFDEMNEISKHAEKIKQEQENAQKDSLKEIQDLTKEYDSLAQKVKKGDELDDKEKKRYQELGTLLNGKDGELVAEVQASSTELEELINSIDGLNSDIVKNIELGDNTIEAATQLAWYESGYKDKTTESNFFMNVSVSDICETLYSTKGESVAKDALNNGENLIEYSNVLGNQLIMNQYVSLYDFATTFTTNAAETINITKEVMGEDFDKSSEEFEQEGEIEGQETEETDEELNMDGLKKMGLGTRKLTAKVLETQQNSAKLAKDAIEEIKAINKENAQLLEEKQAVITEQAQEAQEKVQTQNAENAENPEKAPEDVEEPENPQESSETEEINGEIEANNDKGLTRKEKLEKSLKTNEKYGDFNKDAKDVMTLTGNMGSLSTVFGGTLIANGSQLIAIGVPLLSNFITYMIGFGLVTTGTLMLTAGAGFVGVGTDLISISVDGSDAVIVTGQQIDLTDETIQNAMEAIANGGLVEEEQLSEAEGKRAEMVKNGESLPKQARYFKDESFKNAWAALFETMDNAGIQVKSNKEGKSAEKTAKSVEARTKQDKKEYDELKEKFEKADTEKNDAMEQAIQAGANPDDLKSDDEFTDSDKKRMEELEARIKSVGDKGQQKLFDSLTKIDGLEKLLEGKDETALKAIDYGTVAQVVGTELFDSVKGNVILIYQMVLALATTSAGKFAQKSGEFLNETIEDTREVNDKNRNKINDAQSKITELTMAEAVSPVSQGEDAEEDNSGEDTTQGGDAQGEGTQGVAEGTNSGAEGTNSGAEGTQGKAEETQGTAEGSEESPVMSESVEKIQETPETANVINNLRPTDKSPSGKLTGAAAIAAWSDPIGHINAIGAKFGIDPMQKLSDIQPEKTSKGGKNENEDLQAQADDLTAEQADNEKKGAEAQKESQDTDKDAKKEDKDSQSVQKDAEKSEKQLTKEGNNIVKSIEQDQKEIDELTKDSQKAVEEQMSLMEEFEALNAQNDTLVSEATQNSGGGQQPASPMLSAQNGDEQGGGLLGAQQSGGMQDTSMAANQAQLDTNNQRLVTISARFISLGTRINKNRLSMIRIQGKINKRVRTYEKISKQKVALQKKAQKAEEAKQKKMQKRLAALDLVANVLSIIGSISTIMQVIGKACSTAGEALVITGTAMLSNPFTAIAGAILVGLGTFMEVSGKATDLGGLTLAAWCAIGSATMQVAKAAVLLASGNSMQALTTVISAAISIAASVAGAGGAAGDVMTAISSGLSIVSTSANMTANIQTLKGKEQSGWLNTVSQVAGALSAVAGVASGFTGDKGKEFFSKVTEDAGKSAARFAKATQGIGAIGSLTSTAAQASATVKQMTGKEPGKSEEILSMIGGGLSAAASVMSIGQSAAKAISARRAEGKSRRADGKGQDDIQNPDMITQKPDTTDIEKNQEVETKVENKDENKTDTKKDTQKDTKKDTNDKKVDEEKNNDKSLDMTQPIKGGEIKLDSVEAPDVTKTAENALDKLNQQNNEVQNTQTADDIKNFNIDEHTSEQKQEVEQKSQNPKEKTLDEKVKEKLDKALLKGSVSKDDTENKTLDEIVKEKLDNALLKDNKPEAPTTSRKQERRENFKKTMDVFNKVKEGASAGAQIYSIADSLFNDDDEKKEQGNKVLNLSNMKKGYALMKKVNARRRNEALKRQLKRQVKHQ